MKFNKKLQVLRKEKGLSQENLAEMLNVSRQAVSKWESGQSYPEMDNLIALSEMFGTTIDNFVKDEDIIYDKTNTVSELYWLHRGTFYEYKSKRTLFGLPLVHINIGKGAKKAKGIIAIGNIATGIVSLGLASVGILSCGLVTTGIIGLGTFSVGLLLSIGSISVGTISIGAISVGAFTIGALSVGMFSIGACSIGSFVAIGEYANGHIAIGKIVEGVKYIEVENSNRIFVDVSKEQVRDLINSEFPNLWNWVKNLVVGLFR